MATGGSEVASDEISDFQCLTCSNKPAVNYCVECQGYCCQACVYVHSRFPTLKGHTLLDKSNCPTAGSSAHLPTVPTERCSIHAIKLLDMYCKDHDEVGCTTCMALNHRSCKNVHSIPDDIDLLFEASNVKEINQNVQRSKETLENIGKKKDVLLEGLDLSKKEAEIAIEKEKREIIALVENLAMKSKAEVENLYKSTKAHVEKDREDVNREVHDLEKVMADLQTSEGNKAQQFVCMKIASHKVKEAKKVEVSLQTETEAKITFIVDTDIQAYFRNMKTIGKVSSPNAERTEPYTVKNCKDLNVKLQQDSTTCQIFGSCWTRDGSLLLVDFNNQKLKRADISKMSVNGFCSFDCNPYCVCCTNAQEAVVTFYSCAKYIKFVSIGNQLRPSRKVDINHYCLGITYKDDRLYITDNDKTMYIHDMNGNELKAISQDSSCNGLFSNCRHIAFDDYMQRIFVADYNKGVIILDGQYQLVASFSDSELSGSSAVCTDGRGNIFVCGNSSHNVLQIGYDGKKRGVVVDKSHGVQCPHSVLFDTFNSKLVLTQNNNIVKICDVK